MKIRLDPQKLSFLRERDPRLLSYDIEMTELTGGTFWKPYTKAQVEGTEKFPILLSKEGLDTSKSFMALMTEQEPSDLNEPRIRTCGKALGPAIIRYSGSWATRVYYDFDGHTNGIVPEGFESILTKKQWLMALDYAKAVNAEILVSLANCKGVHKNQTGEWTPDQAEVLWSFTEAHGMKISYAEFMNEPNMFQDSMLPDGYDSAAFARDHDLFAKWLRKNHPETKLVGIAAMDNKRDMEGIDLVNSEDFFSKMTEFPDIFSYHSYTGVSERAMGIAPKRHWGIDKVLTEKYLGATMGDLERFRTLRDTYMPNTDMWVTESAASAAGGNTWDSTYLESIRFVDELCRFATKVRGIIFHNTFARSAYGLLDPDTHEPRPAYWGGYLLNSLTGTKIYDTHESIREGVHLYAFNRKDGKDGVCYVCINNSQTEALFLEVPDCVQYTLSSNKLRSERIFLNGQELKMVNDTTLPELSGQTVAAGMLELAPCTITYLVV